MERKISYAIATVLGVGCLPWAPGTFGTLAALPIIYNLRFHPDALFVVWLVITLVGVWASSRVAFFEERKDPSVVVIDEVSGMLASVLFITPNGFRILMAFLLFRLFDIWKPFGIRRLERFKGGWGIMADDVAAGFLARLILWAGMTYAHW